MATSSAWKANKLIRLISLACLAFALLLVACDEGRSTAQPSSPLTSPTPPIVQTAISALTPTGSPDQSRALLPGGPAIPPGLTHYFIQLIIAKDARSFSGHQTVSYTNHSPDAQDVLYFRLYPNGGQTYGNGHLQVDQVQVAGQPVVPGMPGDPTILGIRLAEPLPPGESIQIELDFSGAVPVDFASDPGSSAYGIYNTSDGILTLANFYPILAAQETGGWSLDPVYPVGDAVYSEIALYTVQLTAPRDLVIATTGIEVDQAPQDGQVIYTYVSGAARDFFIVASPDFQHLSADAGGVTVSSYYLPGMEAAGEAALSVAMQALEVFNQRFGPYPYTELDVVQTPLNDAGGVEYPGIFLIDSARYQRHQDPIFAYTIAHEVAHQWWYNVVGNDVIAAPWLDEGLATYSQALYHQDTNSPLGYDLSVEAWQASSDQAGEGSQISAGLAEFSRPEQRRDFGRVVYARAALFLHALRQEIGDRAFFTALQAYYRDFTYRVATPQDLLDAFEAAAGHDLVGFYQPWLSPQPGNPPPTPTLAPTPTPTPAPTPTPVSSVRFAVIGDYGSGAKSEADVAALVFSWQPDLIITTGDNNYPHGSSSTIDTNVGQFYQSYIFPYLGEYGEGAGTNRFFPSIGNHDWETKAGQPYLDYFTLPGNERYYDFAWGPVHFFAVNNESNEPDGVSRSSVQASWLQASLAAATEPWKIVYMHYPAYSSGKHGSIDWAQWPYATWGASAVIAGHDHTYERLRIDGIPYFVNGLGGADSIYDFVNVLDGSLVRFNATWGAMLVDATGDRITFQFITDKGEIIDAITLERDG